MKIYMLNPGESQPELESGASELAEAMSARGHTVFDSRDALEGERLGAVVSRLAPGLIVTWNGNGLPLEAGQYELDLPGDPRRFVVLMTAHPVHALPALEQMPAGAHIGASCGTHVDFLQRHWPGRFRPFFFPVAASAEVRKGGRREIDVALFGDVHAPEGPGSLLGDAPAAYRRVVEEFFATALINPYAPLHLTYAATLDALGVDVADGEWDRADRFAFSGPYKIVEESVRSRRRLELLTALDKAGVAVDVYGAGYGSLSGTRHRFHAAVGFDERQSIAARCRVVLSSSPRPAGPCEVALNAMVQGAVAMVEANPWHKGTFTHEENALLYEPQDPDAAARALSLLLASRDRLATIGQAGAAFVGQNFDWPRSAKKLLVQVGA